MAGRDTHSLLPAGLLLVLFHTWGAWAAVEVVVEDKVEVYLGDTAQITCTFTSDDGIGGTSIQWFYVDKLKEKQRISSQDSMMTRVDKDTPYTDRISVNSTGASVVLTISDVQLQDEREFICLVKSLTDGVGEGRTRLLVYAAPNHPTIEGVHTGISVHEFSKIGSCEVRNGYPRPNITWYRDSTPLRHDPDVVEFNSQITTESSGLYSVTNELRMEVKKEDKDAQFYCEVTYFVPKDTMMTETRRINITVFYPSTAVDIWVESPTDKIKEGDSIKIHCTANGNMPSVLSIRNLKDDESSDVSTLVLKDVTRQNSGTYECSSMDTDNFEEITSYTNVSVHFLDEAVITPTKTMTHSQGEDLRAVCNALSSLRTHTTWLKNGKEVSRGHTLNLKKMTYDMAGQYVCVVSVPEIQGMQTNSTLHVHVKGSPVIMEGDMAEAEMEVETGKTVELKCSFRGYPVPSITWSSPDRKDLVGQSEQTQQGAQSTISVKVSSDMTLHCNAANDHGKSAKIFNIKAISKSNGVIIAVIIICILLLAILGSVLYFLYKKGKICGRSGKQDFNKGKSGKDNVVVEMKSDKTEEAILLGVNGEKQSPGDQ
ncbi:melanoma cell adhesion molecule b isoform X3 [Cololabis saira]|uniref:melanoma cell adhesion molecule b isoform X3 n=1 Tax=Cololabis saira TaxID=129043 RepID=UPI002AD203AE|nr:melanoma cell adhesion molecule b isoform X3 [Cololabis saira]